MALISDMLIVAASFAAMFYCRSLGIRLRKFKDLDQGVGAAIAALSVQVDELRGAMAATRRVSGTATDNLLEMTARAEIAAGRLEILLANVHDNPARMPQNEAGPARQEQTATRPGSKPDAVSCAGAAGLAVRPREPVARNALLVEGLPGASTPAEGGSDIVRALKQALAGPSSSEG
jgi:hypothetical protein